MIVAARSVEAMNKGLRDAIVDQLRACTTKEQLLAFDERFNQETNAGPLYAVICGFLHDRTISRAVAAIWLKTLLDDREEKLKAKSKTSETGLWIKKEKI